MVDIEICAELVQTVMMADQYGVKRIELCSALDLGGLTPSLGLIEECADRSNIEIFAMIRPRGGGFIYSSAEISVMFRDIKLVKKYGASGVVFGCLNDELLLDEYANKKLLEEAKSLELGVTFHRAIDFCSKADHGVRQLMHWGFDRILTSGHAPTAIEGIDTLKRWKSICGNKMEIMAGSGVNSGNAKELIGVGVDALHFTARRLTTISDLNMGKQYVGDEQKIKNVFSIIRSGI